MRITKKNPSYVMRICVMIRKYIKSIQIFKKPYLNGMGEGKKPGY
jgi:hypothetical protein